MLGEILAALKNHRQTDLDVGINVGINSDSLPEEVVLAECACIGPADCGASEALSAPGGAYHSQPEETGLPGAPRGAQEWL